MPRVLDTERVGGVKGLFAHSSGQRHLGSGHPFWGRPTVWSSVSPYLSPALPSPASDTICMRVPVSPHRQQCRVLF